MYSLSQKSGILKSRKSAHIGIFLRNKSGLPGSLVIYTCNGKALCTILAIKIRVVDPYSFFPDPDPEFDVGDQYGSRALMTKN